MKKIFKNFMLFISIIGILNAGSIERDTYIPIGMDGITTFIPYTMILPDKDNDGIEDSVDTPVAQSQNITVDINSNGYTIVLHGYDNDNPITYTIVMQPTHGKLTGNVPRLTYVPNNGYTGEDSFTFSVNDGVHESQVATIYILVGTYLPACDTSNPEVQMISSVSDWEYINDTNKRIFCVNPGDYSEANITIASSGTEQKRRYLLLNNPSSDHPAKMVDDFVNKTDWFSKFAKYRVTLENANYWTIDRLAYWEDADPFHEIISLTNSSHNIISRSLIVDTSNGIGLYNGSNNNKIEKSHMEKTQWSVDYAKDALQNNNNQYANRIFADLAAMGLNGTDASRMINNVFENNEIINYVDAIQLVRKTYGGTALNIDFSGTKIIGNRFYVTPLLYTDCNGTFKSDGDCSVSENAIDIKAGAHDGDNPIVIEGNIMFGFKQADNTYSDLDDVGSAIVSHFHVANLIIENNTIFNSYYGFGSDGPLDGKIALENLSLHDNILYNIGGAPYWEDDDGEKHVSSIVFDITGSQNSIYDGGKDINISNNKIVNKDVKANNKFYNTDNLRLENNLFVNSNGFWVPVGCEDGYEDYADLYNMALSISYNTFHTNDADILDGIPECAGKDTNNVIEKNFDYSSINGSYIIRKFTSHPQIKNLIQVSFTPKQRKIADQIISIFEHSTTEIQYGDAGVVKDDEAHGITAGRLGFTSATGDMYDFIKNYYNKPPLSKYLPELQRLQEIYANNGYELSSDCDVNTSSCYIGGLIIEGTDFNLTKDWNETANNEEFREAQDRYLDEHYFIPAMEEGHHMQMILPLSLLCFYDAAIQHGVEGLQDIVAQVSLPAPPQNRDEEIAWLKAFNQKRIDVLKSKSYWRDTLYRVHTLNDLIDNEQYELNISSLTIRDWEDQTFIVGQ